MRLQQGSASQAPNQQALVGSRVLQHPGRTPLPSTRHKQSSSKQPQRHYRHNELHNAIKDLQFAPVATARLTVFICGWKECRLTARLGGGGGAGETTIAAASALMSFKRRRFRVHRAVHFNNTQRTAAQASIGLALPPPTPTQHSTIGGSRPAGN